ncbi:MAG: hypothetical protein PHS41_07970 [Victivallaceae bacterium]|nr:hypothetical protein [Victivallaceae bacterium]
MLHNVTLELSGKAFNDDSVPTMHAVARTMFEQWKNLIDVADQLSVMLWLADGSEILEYTGQIDDTFEWACYLGCANACPVGGKPLTERQKRHTHHFPKKYRQDAQKRSYRWTKTMIGVLREEALLLFNREIRVGATFDNGPEFAISDWKFHRHIECATGNTLYEHSFVACDTTLHAEKHCYAGYPDGVPEGTNFGEFLGRQLQHFADDLGYDYIWLSNGMGFGQETWGLRGALFDGERFYPEKVGEAESKMLRFWEKFCAECHLPIETRGSNFSAGIEMATDAAPLAKLYREKVIYPPVNSPWAALNFNSGLELTAWMSHIAELADGGIPFRYYIHDPWFMNSPWLDRYAREPWDLYQPLAISRVDENGMVHTADSVSLLSVDDSYGRMPDQVPEEVIPHLKQALRTAPDQIAPLLWIYPFFEYNEMVSKQQASAQVFNEELYIGESLQGGLPLNTVISLDRFLQLADSEGAAAKLQDRVLIVPASVFAGKLLAKIKTLLDGNHVKLIVYGAARGECAEFFAIRSGKEICGEVQVQCSFAGDQLSSSRAVVLPVYDGGALTEEADSPFAEAVAADGTRRALAVVRDGKAAFVRSVLPLDETYTQGNTLNVISPEKIYPTDRLMRYVLARFGWEFASPCAPVGTLLPRSTVSLHDNAFYYTIYARDTSAHLQLGTPWGAPVFTEEDVPLEHSLAEICPGKCFRRECRLFVRQEEPGIIHSKTYVPAFPGYTGSIFYQNFKDAEVTIAVPKGFEKSFEMVATDNVWFFLDHELLTPEYFQTGFGRFARLRHFTGSLQIAW